MYKALKQKRVNDYKELDYLNFLLGKYIAFAVNDPKKYPKTPFLENFGEERKIQAMSPEQMEEIAKRIANKFSSKK